MRSLHAGWRPQALCIVGAGYAFCVLCKLATLFQR